MKSARFLRDAAWPDVGSPIVVVPVGSCEQHGPHLPLATDTMIACALTDALCERLSNCVVAPAIAIAASGEHAGFPGTLSIGTDVTIQVLIEIARSADWSTGVVFVNGHGGNARALQAAVEVLDGEGRRVLGWSPRVDDGDLHAGRLETSLMLHLHPDAVGRERAVSGPSPTIADLVRSGVRALSPSGVLGDPSGANAAYGAEMFARFTEQLSDAFAFWNDSASTAQ